MLEGRRTVVTGASRGLGRTIATAFVKAGADVLLVATSAEELETTYAEIRPSASSRQRVETCVFDLSNPQTAPSILVNHWFSPDILVNNAGIQGPIGPLWTNDLADWQDVLQLALLSPVALMQAVIPGMVSRRWGRIINVSGGGAATPRPNFSAYAAAKSALVRVTETVALELADSGVTVNAIAPGAMNTHMTMEIRNAGADRAGAREVIAAEELAKRSGTPGVRAAELCVFLASDKSNAVTGKLIAALWDPWPAFAEIADDLRQSDVFTLRRIVPGDRGFSWG
jgi:3-oxoacyl-[acyl-carrier protein] reductase